MDQEGGCTSQARRLALAHGDWEKAHGPLKGAQLGHLSRLQGYAPTEAQLKPYQESERISAENFVKFCEEVGYEDPSFEELSSVFAPFDPEGTGQIPKEVFLHLMTSVGDRFEAEEVDSMMVDLQSGKEALCQVMPFLGVKVGEVSEGPLSCRGSSKSTEVGFEVRNDGAAFLPVCVQTQGSCSS
ncbi:unnamed protein product [Durusdinium trenchii]|uniref:EF-hand domain-containing protein n=1 Tax=Durusdinium trenchii TaxID=1381693 RepID=A0ABP0IU91_9DINO